ncbi:MAG: bifunctional 3-(3-hydroxy-phenyl)propionate/3-hydroxycinnamic acid hydroxylase [Steroidobacteraceae bacterium]
MKAADTYDVDVVIAGLGPTGLTLAHLLGKRGRRVLVLEREPEFYGNARAVYTDDECMRIFQSFDMADALAADMLTDCAVQMQLPDGSVLMQIADNRRPFGWPSLNFFYQPYLETRLAEGLARYPSVRVMRGREVTRFEQDGDGVTVHHHASSGSRYGRPDNSTRLVTDGASVRARYMVGCDGGRSRVRAQLGIEMSGRSFPNPWLVVDIRQEKGEDALRHLPYFSFICDPECPTVSCVQPDGHHRFEFMLMPGQTREYMEDPETVRRHLAKHVDVDRFEILRSLVYTFNALIAARWRDGRVFLAGDAAHMTPQFIGQGMNAGVRDAYNLAWKLDAVLGGIADDALLDTYQSERQPHVRSMIHTAVRMKDYVSTANPVKAWLRNVLTRTAMATPGLGRWLREGTFIPQPSYARGTYFGLPRRRLRRSPCGRQLPQPFVKAPDGRSMRLDELLGNGFALIGIGLDPRSAIDGAELAWWRRLDTRYATLHAFGGRPQGPAARDRAEPPIVIEDVSGELLDWLRAHGHGAGSVVIVRPDRFVYGAVPVRKLAATTLKLQRDLTPHDHDNAAPAAHGRLDPETAS